MTSIGQTLADARRKRKITVKDVEKAIKIRAKYISALERDAFDQIIGEAYVIGFLKTYAQWLQLDERSLLDLYREQAGGSGNSGSGLSDFEAQDERPRSLRTRVIFGVVLLMIMILVVVKVFIK